MPVLNLGCRPIAWNRLRRKWKVEPATAEQILTSSAEQAGSISVVQENLTVGDSNLDHVKIALGVSSEEKKKLIDMLCRH